MKEERRMAISFQNTVSTFFEQYRTSRYAKGQVFLLEGEKADYLYHLIEGRVKVYTISYRGDEVILHVYKPPDFFPTSHLLNEGSNGYIYQAETETVIQRAPIDEVRKLIKAHSSIALGFLEQSYEFINNFFEKQSLLMAGSARRRLMYELVVQCRQFGVENASDRCVLDIHEKDLAARTGLSRETINREVRKLKRENLICLAHRQIIVPNVDNLERKLNQSV